MEHVSKKCFHHFGPLALFCAELRIINILKIPYLKENTTLHHYKD
jgi:hypothetical protein